MKKTVLYLGAACMAAFIAFSAFEEKPQADVIKERVKTQIDAFAAGKKKECQDKALTAALPMVDSLVKVKMGDTKGAQKPVTPTPGHKPTPKPTPTPTPVPTPKPVPTPTPTPKPAPNPNTPPTNINDRPGGKGGNGTPTPTAPPTNINDRPGAKPKPH